MVPADVVTDTDALPAAWTLVEASIVWLDSIVYVRAAVAPNVTAVAAVKWVPKIVTDVPLLVGPAEGLTRVTVGAST